jgi:phenylpyruvate tautomerase PptA (4-oxalocrotonate tautomerase family)
MPLVEVTVPKGLLDAGKRASLAAELTTAVLKAEGAPDNDRSRALTWVFLQEAPEGTWAVGGKWPSGLKFLVRLTVPVGSLSPARKRKMGATLHKVLSDHSGRPLKVEEAWILTHEVPEGNWSAGGKVLRFEDIVKFVASAGG